MSELPHLPADWPSNIHLPPFDEANARLLRAVAPKGWIVPVPKGRYHLVVIGAGTAGLVSAAIAAGLGARVALVERHLFGGDCLNFGCVPSKALIRAARAWHEARRAAREFGAPSVADDGDFGRVMQRLRDLRADLSVVDGVERFRSLGVDVFLGNATFMSPDAVRVDDAVLPFRRAIIATGARAAVPDIDGLAHTPYDTNETIFSAAERPRHLAIIGGGPVGTELAQAFARLGTRVTLLNSASRLLSRDDEDAAAIVAQSLAEDGVHVMNAVTVDRVGHDGNHFALQLRGMSASAPLLADRLLVAAGRSPNIQGLGLDVAQVRCTPRGVVVDDRLRTTNHRIYAIGDVASSLQFTHVADAQARLVVANALFFGVGGGRVSSLTVPRVTYTDPEVAQVGLTAHEAAAAGQPIDTVVVEMADNDRARLDGASRGLLKVHLAKGTDRIIGATLVAEHAGEMISELTVAMTHRLGLAAVGRVIHPYPTQSEVFRKAADMWRRSRLTPTARKVFDWWFRRFS